MAVNKEGTWKSNVNNTDVNAVTWGVFPAKEIIQPTVVDPQSFMVWKDEAFEIWSRGWAKLYPEDDPSRKLLEEVNFFYIWHFLEKIQVSVVICFYCLVCVQLQSKYYLVSLVDNDYVHGDLFAVFKER